ncbi:GGDEF domain-containing protein [Candidatus Omnitrophota bacterium]
MLDVSRFQKDLMTGAYARENLRPALKKRIIDAKLRQEKVTILLLDNDRFKAINEKYGHLWGDQFLKFESSSLRATFEEKGLIFRFGGDEFVIIFHQLNPKQAYLLSRQFNRVLENRPFLFNGRLFKMTISCGLATFPDDAQNAEDLLKAADKALHISKKYGRNTVTQASQIKWRSLKRKLILFSELAVVAILLYLALQLLPEQDLGKNIKQHLLLKLSTILKPNTKIILKDDRMLEGHLISEDKEKLTIFTTLDKKDAKFILKQ